MLMVEVHNLTKVFGETTAVDGVTFDLMKGDMCGFIGPNGAGKTTTIKIVASLLPPTSGSVFIGGRRLWPDGNRSQIAHSIGYMPDQFGVYENMKVWEYLEFFGLAYKIPEERRKKTAEDILLLTDLIDVYDEFVLNLSRGMQQRLSLSRVLLHDPEVLLLDEPASGLDPQARIEMRALLSELREMGKTILISSHILTELATVCNKVCIVQSGQMVFSGTSEELQEQVMPGQVYLIAVEGKLEKAAQMLKLDEKVESVETEDDHLRVSLKNPFPGEGYLSAILQKGGMHITLYQPQETSLEDAYMKLLEE